MPSLLDSYKEYNKLMKKLDVVYKKLEAQQGVVNGFLAGEEALYEQRKNLKLLSVPLGEKLESLKKKKGDAEAELSKMADPNSEEARKLTAEIAAKTAAIPEQQRLIEENKQALVAVENQLTWVKENVRLSTTYTKAHGASQAGFNAYMDTANEAIKLKVQLLNVQSDIQRAISKTPVPEREAALKWSKDNNVELVGRVNAVGNNLLKQFHYDLHEAHQKAANSLLDSLGKDKYREGFQSGKYHLDDLENFAAAKGAKQANYRSILPAYAAAEIPADVHIKGTRSWGIGKTNTSEKVNDIKDFLEKPFSANKNQDLANLKTLFNKVGVNLSDVAIDRIYTAAAVQQQQKLAEPERGPSAG